jgi:hypothetical protein
MSSVVSSEKLQKRKDAQEEKKTSEEMTIEEKKAPEDSGSVFLNKQQAQARGKTNDTADPSLNKKVIIETPKTFQSYEQVSEMAYYKDLNEKKEIQIQELETKEGIKNFWPFLIKIR